jgi:hypothetical protein
MCTADTDSEFCSSYPLLPRLKAQAGDQVEDTDQLLLTVSVFEVQLPSLTRVSWSGHDAFQKSIRLFSADRI